MFEHKNESKHKRLMRKANDSCFIPRGYYKYGFTQKDYFKRNLLKTLRKIENL